MRNLVFTLFFVGVYGVVNAQSEPLNWLNQNKPKLDYVDCPTSGVYGEKLVFTDHYIEVADDNDQCRINWKDVIKVAKKGEYFHIVSSENKNEKPLEIIFYIKDQDITNNFIYRLRDVVDYNKNQLALK